MTGGGRRAGWDGDQADALDALALRLLLDAEADGRGGVEERELARCLAAAVSTASGSTAGAHGTAGGHGLGGHRRR